MTQRQHKIIEEYLFDVFLKMDGDRFLNESYEVVESWWNDIFLLEAITDMGQQNYTFADFCKPNVFFGNADQEEGPDEGPDEGPEEEQKRGPDTDIVVNYLKNFYEHEDYYDYFVGNGMYEQDPYNSTLQIQYLYVYTVENREYLMNNIMYGSCNTLK